MGVHRWIQKIQKGVDATLNSSILDSFYCSEMEFYKNNTEVQKKKGWRRPSQPTPKSANGVCKSLIPKTYPQSWLNFQLLHYSVVSYSRRHRCNRSRCYCAPNQCNILSWWWSRYVFQIKSVYSLFSSVTLQVSITFSRTIHFNFFFFLSEEIKVGTFSTEGRRFNCGQIYSSCFLLFQDQYLRKQVVKSSRMKWRNCQNPMAH